MFVLAGVATDFGGNAQFPQDRTMVPTSGDRRAVENVGEYWPLSGCCEMNVPVAGCLG
jgi:hypothetical protein